MCDQRLSQTGVSQSKCDMRTHARTRTRTRTHTHTHTHTHTPARDVNETFMPVTETFNIASEMRRSPTLYRDNLKQSLSSNNVDAIDHHHSSFNNSEARA